MNIDRKEPQPYDSARQRITFCLDMLEKAKSFSYGMDWSKEIVENLTIEEVIGALVSAEQELE